MVEPHTHNNIDTPKLNAKDALEKVPQATVSEVVGTAGATYGATEQGIINNTKNSLNDLIEKLQAIGLIS